MLATSDLPGGVINLLSGLRKELVPTFATHAGLRAVDAAGCSPEEVRALAIGAAESVKRLRTRGAGEIDWFSEATQGVEEIASFVEFKTIWHPIGA
jgi:aldehyde dehydrogenase (NAD+)